MQKRYDPYKYNKNLGGYMIAAYDAAHKKLVHEFDSAAAQVQVEARLAVNNNEISTNEGIDIIKYFWNLL